MPPRRRVSAMPSSESFAWSRSWEGVRRAGRWHGGHAPGFLDEAAAPIEIVRQIFGQDLEGDVAIEANVRGAVHDSHAPAADFIADALVAERAAGQ
jgi:hypothetical protein